MTPDCVLVWGRAAVDPGPAALGPGTGPDPDAAPDPGTEAGADAGPGADAEPCSPDAEPGPDAEPEPPPVPDVAAGLGAGSGGTAALTASW